METMTDQTKETERPVAIPASRQGWAALLVVALAAALLVLWLAGALPRRARLQALKEAAAAQMPTFVVSQAVSGTAAAELVLPSSVEAAQETPLYPRVNGYVKTLFTDIGARVQAGDALAEIETPEIDQQVSQARAALEQARANLLLAQTSYGRWDALQKSRVVAPQEVDERKGSLDARQAELNAAEANLQRLTRMQGFQKITAPFAGTVTKRFVEVGQLVTGDLNDSTRALFQLQQTETLRAFVSVPQSAFRSVNTGQKVAVSFREFPGRSFEGTVVRTAGALDGATRTLRTEIQVPNESRELLPGLYAEVRFQLQREQPPVVIPSRALILQTAGPQVAVVDEKNQVSLRTVALGRDLGKTLEVASGLAAGARFVANPSDILREGMTIRVDPMVAAEK